MSQLRYTPGGVVCARCATTFCTFRRVGYSTMAVALSLAFGVDVVPPTQPAFSGIESARFRMLRVGGMPLVCSVRSFARCLFRC